MKMSAFLILVLLTFLGACGTPVGEEGSEVKGALQQRTPVCQAYPEADLNTLKQAVAGLKIFHNFTAEEEKELILHMYAVPPIYRDKLIEKNKSGDFKGVFKSNINRSGLCYIGAETCTKIELSSTQKGVINFSLIHEFAHGFKAGIARAAGMSNSDFDVKIREFMDEAKAHNGTAEGRQAANVIRSYSFTSEHEFFSDTFQNYYCSPASHEFIKKFLPKNYAFMQKVLAQPMWLKDGGPIVTPSDKGEADYANALTSFYNDISTSCDLEAVQVAKADAQGAFKASLHLKSASNETVEVSLNMNTPLARQMSELRRGISKLFASCPIE